MKSPTADAIGQEIQSSSRLVGAHMPTAGGLANALISGHAIGCTAIQLFTSSPRQWNSPPLDPSSVEKYNAALKETGVSFTVAHDSYLINLCAVDPELLDKSRKAFLHEIERADQLGIPWLVTHMGAHMQSGEETGITGIVESVQLLLKETEGMHAGIALETTAGQGTCLGYTFEQVARVLDRVEANPRLGVCVDTCHIFAAGYDIRNEDGYCKTWERFDRLIGLDRLKVIHVNDSKKPLGSRVDRHEHIGQGEIGLPAFERLVNDPALFHVPLIIETPESEKMHAVNLNILKSLQTLS